MEKYKYYSWADRVGARLTPESLLKDMKRIENQTKQYKNIILDSIKNALISINKSAKDIQWVGKKDLRMNMETLIEYMVRSLYHINPTEDFIIAGKDFYLKSKISDKNIIWVKINETLTKPEEIINLNKLEEKIKEERENQDKLYNFLCKDDLKETNLFNKRERL